MADKDDSPPTKVVVVLGEMQFDPSGESDILSIKVQLRDELSAALEEAGRLVGPSSLGEIHILIKSSSVGTMFDSEIITTFFDKLRPGGEFTVHVLGSADMPVQPADVNDIRVSLLMANLFLEREGTTDGDEGGWTLKAVKGGDDTEEATGSIAE